MISPSLLAFLIGFLKVNSFPHFQIALCTGEFIFFSRNAPYSDYSLRRRSILVFCGCAVVKRPFVILFKARVQKGGFPKFVKGMGEAQGRLPRPLVVPLSSSFQGLPLFPGHLPCPLPRRMNTTRTRKNTTHKDTISLASEETTSGSTPRSCLIYSYAPGENFYRTWVVTSTELQREEGKRTGEGVKSLD